MEKATKIILTCLIGIMLSAFPSMCLADSTAKYKLTFHSWESPGSLHWAPNYLAFKKSVEKKSNGRITIDLQAGGAIGTMKEGLNLVRSGIAEIGFVPDNYHQEEFPLSMVFTLPMGQTAAQKAAWYRELYDEYFAEENTKQNVVTIGAWPLADMGLFTRKKKLRKLSDLKGLTVRTNGELPAKGYAKLGAIPMNMPFTEAIQAIEKGVLESVTCNPSYFPIYKLHESGKPGNYYDIGGMPSGLSTFKINKKVFDSLPKDLQKIVFDDGWEFLGQAYCKVKDDMDLEGKKLIEERGGEYIVFSTAEKEKLRKTVTDPMWQDWAKQMNEKGLAGSKVVSAVRAKWSK